jgi:hypothetical protein
MRPKDALERAARMAANDTIILHPLVGGLDADLSWATLRNFFGKVAPQLSINPL